MSAPNDDDPERAAFLRAHRAAARHADAPAAQTRARLEAGDARARVRRDVAIVSMGNACEAHSSALAPDIDDRTGAHVSVRVANLTGARYLGHCPYATDRLDGLAQQWSPACLPEREFLDRTTAHLRFMLAAVAPPRVLWLLSGHGGNAAIVPHLPRLAADLGLARVRYELAFRLPPGFAHTGVHHAGDVEHAVARALGDGAFDAEALARLNDRLADDVERTIKDEPALGGMAGYYVHGDARFDPIRRRYPGVKASVAELLRVRRVEADAALGAQVLEHSARALAADVLADVEP